MNSDDGREQIASMDSTTCALFTSMSLRDINAMNNMVMNEVAGSNAQQSCIGLAVTMANLYHELHVATDEKWNLKMNNSV